jgi:signal transduction histidine kinase
MSHEWKRIVLRTIVTLLIFWIVFPGHVGAQAAASKGILDLSNEDFSTDRVVPVQAEWEFYWDRLLTPEDFAPGRTFPVPTGLLALPGSWKGYRLHGRPLGGLGQATFRLRLLTGDAQRLALRLCDIQMAYRLWANGELVAQSGVPSDSPATERPQRSVRIADLNASGRHVDLLLQISNHSFRKGGVPGALLLASPATLQARQVRTWGASLFFAGSLLLMGCHQIIFYFWRRKEISALYFGVYCLLLVGYTCCSNTTDWVVTLFMRDISPLFLERFSMTCYLVSGCCLYRFFKNLYPSEFSNTMLFVSDMRSFLLSIVTLFFPMTIVYKAIVLGFFATIIFPVYYLIKLFRCFCKGYNGASFLLVGAILLFATSVNDILSHSGFTQSPYMITVGLLVFVLCQAIALGQNVSKAFLSAERLSGELVRQKAALQEEMVERSRLEREVVNISEEERRRISHELHDGLCQKLASARLWCSALLQNQPPPAAGETLTHLLRDAADDAYRISRGLWPVEHDPSVPGPSLEELVNSVGRNCGIAIAFRQTLQCGKCVNPNATPLYRIAQEALANAVKHAKAGRIEVCLCCEAADGLVMTVSDDGIGRGAARRTRGGLGLAIMAHRAQIIGAALRIDDGPKGGTRVQCTAACPRTGAAAFPTL